MLCGSLAGQTPAAQAQLAAAAQQRQSVRQQMGQTGEAKGFFTVDWPAPPAVDASVEEEAADCLPLSALDAETMVREAAQRHALDRDLLFSVIERESAFKPCATSAKGAMGLMQLMPETAEQFKVPDPYNPKQNVEAGAKFLKELLTRYDGKFELALAAYNAGPGRVDEAKGIPQIAETKQYVAAIMDRYRKRKLPNPTATGPPDSPPKP